MDEIAGMAELADALDLGSSGRPCRFESCCPHSERDFRAFVRGVNGVQIGRDAVTGRESESDLLRRRNAALERSWGRF